MAAPKNTINKYKNTRKALNDMLDKMIEHLKENTDVINILDLTTYFSITNKWFSNIIKSVDGRPWQREIENKINIIYDIVEKRRLEKGEKATNAAWHIFILKAYHRKVEEVHLKTENKNENSGEIKISIDYGDEE